MGPVLRNDCIGVLATTLLYFLGFRILVVVVVIFIERPSNDGYILLPIDIVCVVVAIVGILRDGGGFITKFVQQ